MSNSDSENSYRAYLQRSIKNNPPSEEELDALETYRVYLKLLPDQARKIQQEVLGLQTQSQAADSTKSSTAPPAQTQLSFIVPNAKSSDRSQNPAEPQPSNQPLHSDSLKPPTVKPEGFFSEPPSHQPDPTANTAAPETTMTPTKPPEQYFADGQQYEREFLQALRAEGFNLKDETRERLRKLAIELELPSSDVADIERSKLVEVYLTNQPRVEPPPSPPLPSLPTSLEEKYDPNLQAIFDELKKSLEAGDFREADIATFDILLRIIRPPQAWLDETSLRSFSAPSIRDKNAIQEIDRLWDEYSDGNFGFSQQLQLYSFGAVPSNDKDLDRERQEHRILALAFSRSAQWWIDGLEFLKYYNQLDFTTEAPKAHLPAWWFWKIPRLKAFQYGGLGLFKERGGCRVDAYTLPAFMYVLKKCGIKPR